MFPSNVHRLNRSLDHPHTQDAFIRITTVLMPVTDTVPQTHSRFTCCYLHTLLVKVVPKHLEPKISSQHCGCYWLVIGHSQMDYEGLLTDSCY